MESTSFASNSDSVSTGTSTGASQATQSTIGSKNLDKDPLWKHVTIVEKLKERGGNTRIRCSFCNNEFTGSYYRVKAHLLKIKGGGVEVCKKVNNQILAGLQREVSEAAERNKPVNVPLPPQMGSGWEASDRVTQIIELGAMEPPQAQKRKAENSITKAFNNEGRQLLDAEIARAFYSGGLPFHFARNPHIIRAFKLATSLRLGGYSPPTYNALRTTLLQKERANIEKLLEPVKFTWKEKGVSVVSDGWSDSQRRPLINVMAVSESGPMFIKAVNCEGEHKDKFFIANLIKEVILEVGPQNIVQVVTDNAPVCKVAGRLIEAQFSHIFWTPCVVHTLNLALKNICTARGDESNEEVYNECHWITEARDSAVVIRNFILNHQMRLTIYNKFAPLKLLSIAETRFAFVHIMLKRLKLMKRALENMVLSEEWSSYREDDRIKAQSVRSTILDELWWDKVDYIIKFTSPIYDMLRFADTDKPYVHLIYDMWDSMIEDVKHIIYRHEGKDKHEESGFYNVVHEILVSRWNKSSSPLHCLAHSLNPRYYSDAWLSAAPNRVPPHLDEEISQERNKCLERYFPDRDARAAVSIEFARFAGKLDVFSSPPSLQDRGTMESRMWWLIYGSGAPNLLKITLRLLGQPCSSSCCERNWSTYSFIHSIRRNKIQPQRAEDLVFVHNNLRLLSRKSEDYMQGETTMWDIGGDQFDPLDGAEELEFANLSLDEPEIEARLIDNLSLDDN